MSISTVHSQQNSDDWKLLIDAARNGCDTSLGEIVDQVRGYLLVIAGSRLSSKLKPKFSASDIVQISMIEAQADLKNFRGSTFAEIKSWLSQIVIHNLTDEAKRFTSTRSRDVCREVQMDGLAIMSSNSETPSRLMRIDEANLQLLRAVDELSPRQRFVVIARFREGLGYPEIARQLEVSEAAARQLWTRAAEKLRGSVGELK